MTTPTSNTEFLQAVFAGLKEPHRPFVLGFEGKPKDRKAWGGFAYRTGKDSPTNPACNWYYSLAVYAPAEDGYHRQEKHCAAVFGPTPGIPGRLSEVSPTSAASSGYRAGVTAYLASTASGVM